MAESLESLVEKFRINLTETIRKVEEENHEKEATLETKHQQEMKLIGDKEKVEREELDAKQKVERKELDAKQKLEKEELDAKHSQGLKDLTVKQHQEKEKLKNDYGKTLKAVKDNKMCSNTSKKEVPECPVCLESMNPPMRIFQCSQGHYVCEDCNNNKEIKSCPTCRRQIVGRNIGMEHAIQLIGAPVDIPRWHQREVVQNQQKSGVESQIDIRSAESGLTCDDCTLINKEGDKFCDACGASLGMVYSPIRPARKNSLDYPDVHWPSQIHPMGRGRYIRLQCLTETTASGQIRPVGRGRYNRLQLARGRPVGVDRGRGFPPSVHAAIPRHINQMKAAQASQFHNGMSMHNGGFPPPVPAGPAMCANGFRMNDVEGNNHMHVPTGRFVELETQEPRRSRRGGARARDSCKRNDYWDFVYKNLEDFD